MQLNHYRTLGRSGLRVSPLCLGAMTFGEDWGWGSDVPTTGRIIEAYLARGGNFIDTANAYTRGHSEKIIGDHLGHDRAKRDRVVLATKFMSNLYPGDPNGGGAHRKAIIAACEQSLRRLRTDYIDLYLMHFMDPYTPIDETMRTLDDLVRAGHVRYIGFSDTPAWVCVQAHYEAIFRGWTPLINLQIEYNLLQRTVEADLIPMAQKLGLGVTPWSPLKGGVLTGKHTRQSAASGAKPGRGEWVTRNLSEEAYRVVDVLVAVAREAGCTPSQAAIAWLQTRPAVSSVIIGARTMEQLEDNLRSLEVTLTQDHLARLDEATKPALPFPHDFIRTTLDNTQGGTTINGRESKLWALAPKSDAERY
jgi:aryl-alcohol dehydrogenase-like predicted oxidoreductase